MILKMSEVNFANGIETESVAKVIRILKIKKCEFYR